ncbi:MAG: hypothetical protein JKY37_19500 [Nannocystaceae bacterium]|nr:hypothetical protein [Nannocystaceae bacterium]
MRAAMCRMAPIGLVALFVATTTACLPDKDKQPDWQKAPKSYDVKGADLTFNELRLEAFNSMESAQRATHLAELAAKAGSFKGQAIYRRGTELGEKMDDVQYGQFEVYAVTPGPEENQEIGVWLEVNIEYHLFLDADVTKNWATGSYIEFTGTFADMSFQDSSKPRKMEIKVKADSVTLMKD